MDVKWNIVEFIHSVVCTEVNIWHINMVYLVVHILCMFVRNFMLSTLHVNTESKFLCIYLQGTFILVSPIILMIFLLDVWYFFGVLNFPWKLPVTWWNRNKHNFRVSVFVRNVTVPIGEHAVLLRNIFSMCFPV